MVPNSVRLIDQGFDPEERQDEDACGAKEDSWASGWIVSGAEVALVALAVGLVGPAWSASGDDGKVRTFRSEALSTEQNFLDLGAAGTSLGDQIVFTTQLLKGDTEVGHQGGACTVASVQRNEAQCVATYSLRGGQITGQALIILGDPAPYAVPITRGSGQYKGVEGEVRVRPASKTHPRGILTFSSAGRIGPRLDPQIEGRAGAFPCCPSSSRRAGTTFANPQDRMRRPP